MLSFSFIPAASENTASSRIRVYTLHRALVQQGIPATLGYCPDADLLFIQKKVREKTHQMAREARAHGHLVLYDVDDLGDALWHWVSRTSFREMLHLADLVTTDTVSRRDSLMADYGVTHVEVIPDAIDYYPVSPVRLPQTESKPLRILWFGNVPNLTLFEKYARLLTRMPSVEVVVMTRASVMKRLFTKYPAIVFVPWSRPTFISVLQSCHVTCLMHDGSENDRTKSNNKMITSIAWGVPAVVSRTPEYERTAHEAEVEYALFADRSELQDAVERLRSPEARSAYIATAQPVIWSRYAPEVIARHFLSVVARYKPLSVTVSHKETQRHKEEAMGGSMEESQQSQTDWTFSDAIRKVYRILRPGV